MKTQIQTLPILTALLAAGLLVHLSPARAANYGGNGSVDWGGAVGAGTLSVTDDGTNFTIAIIPSGGNLSGNGVALYIDTGSGGFTNTSGFQDASDGGHIVASGYTGSGRSVLTFTNGFRPSYAVSIGDDYTSLYQLANGGNGSFTYLTGEGGTPYRFTFPAADLGLAPGRTATIRIFGSLISHSAFRSSEAIAGNAVGFDGYYPFSQTAFATYVFDPAVVPTNMVTFQVDMTEQIALGNFNPANGDTVYAAGTFQTTPWSGFLLTNNPVAANPNLYRGAFPDNNAAGTVEQYKYNFYSVANSGATWDNLSTIPNRSFTLQSGGQVLAPAYFSNLPASPSATTNTVVFQIDLTPQIHLGNFVAANGDQIQVVGSFGGSPWSTGVILLTNNPASAQSNLYSGPFADANYPGTQYQYKYVIINGSENNYETIPNRNLVTPANFAALPVAYFNNAGNVYATPVTFQVDLTVPIAAGSLNLGNGDTVSAAGTFQSSLSAKQWSVGTFVLTNNPAAANTNIFTGTFIDPNPPGSYEQFNFQINPAGNASGATWESLGNRVFLLSPSAQILPVADWNNQDPNNVLLVPTTVTFTVNMANVVDDQGDPFDPANDLVIVDGDFLNPPFPNFWTDPQLGGADYSQNLMMQVGLSALYTITFALPVGNPLAVQYKYGIIHSFNGFSNTNADNEAGYGLNHTRFIRATGAYNFPVDVFGIQLTNPVAATEPSFGDLVIARPVGGRLPVSWLGGPGVYLQYRTNLAGGPWVQLNATGGASSTNWPQTKGPAFFRLVKP